MKKKSGHLSHKIKFAILLLLLSVLVYALHYVFFHDAHHIFIYFVGDVGFVFIEVLLVTLILHQVLSEREKRSLLKKLNMVIGAFFSEVGTELLRSFRDFDVSDDKISQHLVVDKEWSDEHFGKVNAVLANRRYKVDHNAGNIAGLQRLLLEKKSFLLGLLENPNLLEHESFTELLWAVSHLAEELSFRNDVSSLAESDYQHLEGDIIRGYRLIVREWLAHMKHLKKDYPYLFSLAMRTNPFDASASVYVK